VFPVETMLMLYSREGNSEKLITIVMMMKKIAVTTTDESYTQGSQWLGNFLESCADLLEN
jgi:hypothetical protein